VSTILAENDRTESGESDKLGSSGLNAPILTDGPTKIKYGLAGLGTAEKLEAALQEFSQQRRSINCQDAAPIGDRRAMKALSRIDEVGNSKLCYQSTCADDSVDQCHETCTV
jgi:hypothetical protein